MAGTSSARKAPATGTIPASTGVVERIHALKRGLLLAFFDQLQEDLRLPSSALAAVVNIPLRTLARRKAQGRFRLDESERIERLRILFDHAAEVLGGKEEARTWLNSPKRALENATPLQFSDTGPGVQEVENLLGRIEHGVFS